MRALPVLTSVSIAAAAFLAVTSARADGAVVTIRNASGTLIDHQTVTSLSIGSQQNSGGKVGFTPTSFEVAGPTGFPALFSATMSNDAITVVVDFTTADAQGREQVSSTAKFEHGAMSRVGFSLDDSGFVASYSFGCAQVEYVTTATATAPTKTLTLDKIPVLRRTPGRAPMEIAIGAVAHLPAQKIDSAYLDFAAPSFPRTKLKSAKGDVDRPINLGSSAGATKLDPMTVVIARSSPTAAFQPGHAFAGGTLSFVHTNADGSTTPMLTLRLKDVAVKSDSFALTNGAGAETTTFAYANVMESTP
jgi:type VI protein secretion system component Hcp